MSVMNVHGITKANRGSVLERVNANLTCYRLKTPNFSKIDKSPYLSMIGPKMKAIDSVVYWCLVLYPNGTNVKNNDDFITVAVDYYTKTEDITATFELSIVNIDNEVMEQFKLKKQLVLEVDKVTPYPSKCSAGFFHLKVKRSYVEDPKNNLLANDWFTLSFDVTYHDPVVKIPVKLSSKNKEDTMNDYGNLLESGDFSDVTIVVGNKTIQAHKAILATCSPVFQAMFTNDMLEKKHNIVDIVDIDYPIVMELLRFMYTGKVRDFEKLACNLLVAADMYCVERLRSMCENFLLEDLRIDNVIERFTVADTCNVKELRGNTFMFILEHVEEIVDRDEFVSLSPLMHEILRGVLARMNK